MPRRIGTTKSLDTSKGALKTQRRLTQTCSVQNSSKGYSPIEDANTFKPSMESKDNAMFIVISGASLHMTGDSSLSLQEKQTIRQTRHCLDIQDAKDIVRSAKEARVYIQELGTHLCVKSVEDSPLVLSLGRLCPDFEHYLRLATGEQPTLRDG